MNSIVYQKHKYELSKNYSTLDPSNNLFALKIYYYYFMIFNSTRATKGFYSDT